MTIEWIPITDLDRLPPHGQRVLIWDDDNDGSGSVAIGWRSGPLTYSRYKQEHVEHWRADNYGQDGADDFVIGITHWSPMPLGPKGQKERGR